MKQDNQNRTTVIGIVGGIGSGKSFVTAEFVAQGAIRFDADVEAKLLYQKTEVLNLIQKQWNEVLSINGEVNFKKLASIVFSPTEQGAKNLAILNSILHPLLFQKFQTWLDNQREAEFAILDAPLLFEVGWENNVDYIVFVDADERTRQRRVKQRGWTSDELTRRESHQLPLEIKKAQADFVVNASRDESDMGLQVFVVLESIRKNKNQ